ncbi:MarR family EPS-associated transcriptional regulator [Sphingomicrobium astaxanthinifaciens]|uniref:MarR family EPS-associated transcriptional regulator n=1 Tax=Sphingomicrobium astaxanthinifaciens TaxID=1227949 RepID=UPI001FCBD7F5|nr:MarR family EPS-associated transcriptional regulator [Sphingomicrobium astaxanthinifaciens]MCJ7420415.1 MarR family EPS-associated transcriptional regulator [Sphingomicrobium astaxanthinifaciens]
MTRDLIDQDRRFRMLRSIEANPRISQRELAREVGVSAGAANYLLKALVAKGWVKLGNFRASSTKRRYAYLLTPSGMAEKAAMTRAFLARKRAEHAALKAEIAALTAELEQRGGAGEGGDAA